MVESDTVTIRIKQKKFVKDAVLCEIHTTVEELLSRGQDGKGAPLLPWYFCCFRD